MLVIEVSSNFNRITYSLTKLQLYTTLTLSERELVIYFSIMYYLIYLSINTL